MAVVLPYGVMWIVSGMVQSLGGPDLMGLLWLPMAFFFVGWWLTLMVGALLGKRFHAPFIGWQADKQLA